MDKEFHFVLRDETAAYFEEFRKKHGFESDFDAIISMIGLIMNMDKSKKAEFMFRKDGTARIVMIGDEG